jgi:hypothetical protein
MICSQCNKDFIKSYRTQKYCSKECTKIYRKEYSKKYQKTALANRVKETKLKKIVIKVCIQCAKEFTPTKTTPYQKTCSQKCRTSFGNSQVKKKGIRSFICVFCSKEFNSIRKKKYCSLKCSKEKNLEGVKKDPLRNEKRLTKAREKRKNRSEEQKIKDRGAVVRYRSKNLEKVRASHRKSKKMMYIRRKSDPLFKLIRNARSRIGKILKLKNIKKLKSTIESLGCTPEFFKKHIEKQWKPGMTWKNYKTDGWHVDHKDPLDLAMTPEDVVELSHYTNLQPMWATENLKKGNKII